MKVDSAAKMATVLMVNIFYNISYSETDERYDEPVDVGCKNTYMYTGRKIA